jgi:glycosyltransferase involved in cell wall biosynthesis
MIDATPHRPFFTVFVPTYNRAYCLGRAIDSVRASSCQDLELLIVDDGSEDGTRAVVEDWAGRAGFPVRYLYQSNAGKHAAHNRATQQAEGFLMLTLDSDDSLLPEALAAIKHHWNDIPPATRDHYAGVGGLVLEEDGSISGTPYPQDVLDATFLQLDTIAGLRGDKREALRVDVLRRFPYPTFPGENFIRPTFILRRLAHEYRTRFVNVPFVLGRRESDGVTRNLRRYRARNPRGMRLTFLEEVTLHDRYMDPRQLQRNHVRYVRYSWNSGIGALAQFREVKHKARWLRALPEGTLSALGDLVRRKVRPDWAPRK